MSNSSVCLLTNCKILGVCCVIVLFAITTRILRKNIEAEKFEMMFRINPRMRF